MARARVLLLLCAAVLLPCYICTLFASSVPQLQSRGDNTGVLDLFVSETPARGPPMSTKDAPCPSLQILKELPREKCSDEKPIKAHRRGPEPLKDLLIVYGESHEEKYTGGTICPIVRSLIATNFSGDIVVIQKNINNLDTLIQATRGRVTIVDADKYSDKAFESKVPHLRRFNAMFQYLRREAMSESRWLPCTNTGHEWCGVYTVEPKYRYVMTFDMRDVVFQSNPSIFLEQHLGRSKEIYGQKLELLAATEGFRFRCDHDIWNHNNEYQMRDCCPSFNAEGRNELVLNVGELAGTQLAVMHMMRSVYEAGKNNPVKICDQGLFNQIIYEDPWIKERTLFSDACLGWAMSFTQMSSLHGVSYYMDHPIIASISGHTWKVQCSCQREPHTPVVIHQYNQFGKSWKQQKDELIGPYTC